MLMMNEASNISSTLFSATESYIAETMHYSLKLRPWPNSKSLPLYLRNAYEFQQGDFHSANVLWLFARDKVTPQTVEKHMIVLSAYWDGRIVVVFSQVPTYMRRRLMERAISFVAPGAQLYLPEFGLDFRSRAKRPTPSREWLRPSAQALLLYLLMHPSEIDWTASMLAPVLGQTAMTTSRAIAELKTHGLVETSRSGRAQRIRLCGENRTIWDAAQGVLRSPVKRRLMIGGATALREDCLIAGISALSRRTMIASERVPAYATSSKTVKLWTSHTGMTIEGRSLIVDDGEIWTAEEWTYSPTSLSAGPEVDPLSLYLSLREDSDERVQDSLREMLENLSW